MGSPQLGLSKQAGKKYWILEMSISGMTNYLKQTSSIMIDVYHNNLANRAKLNAHGFLKSTKHENHTYLQNLKIHMTFCKKI